VVVQRQVWLRLVVLDLLLIGTLMAFVLYESWLVGLNLDLEGGLSQMLRVVSDVEQALFVSILLATAVVGVAGMVYAWSHSKQLWPYLALAVLFLAFVVVIYRARPSREVIDGLSARPTLGLEELLR